MRLKLMGAAACALLWSVTAFAGEVVYTGKYAPHTVVQGFGASQDDAIADAAAAVPGGYFLDQQNDWDVVQRTNGQWMATRPLKHECAPATEPC